MNSIQHLTGFEAQQMLLNAGAGTAPTSIVQLDGGGSTQLNVDIDGDGDGHYAVASDDFLVTRNVPSVLAVYLGP